MLLVRFNEDKNLLFTSLLSNTNTTKQRFLKFKLEIGNCKKKIKDAKLVYTTVEINISNQNG